MAAAFHAFLNSPVGPKTTHIWGPVANWGFVVAKQAKDIWDGEATKFGFSFANLDLACATWASHVDSPDTWKYRPIKVKTMRIYSGLFMRFAWMVQLRNYLLLVCHASNETVQLYQFSRWAKAQGSQKKEETKPE